MANVLAEDRLGEAEKWQILANMLLHRPCTPEKIEDLWKGVLFNQFHDILCGCSIESAYADAQAFLSAAQAGCLRIENQALQAISWAIDTDRGVTSLTKEENWQTWEYADRGTPIVVFNPLSRPITVPIRIRQAGGCGGVTYEDASGEHAIPWQRVRGDVTNGGDKYVNLICAPLPAFGYRTFWIYGKKQWTVQETKKLYISEHAMENDRISLAFDPQTGCLCDLTEKQTGRSMLGAYGAKALLIDDSACDTWSHNTFVFDKVVGTFSDPVFRILEDGDCTVSLSVTQRCGDNSISQVYTLYPGEDMVHVSVRVFMNEPGRMVKLAFRPAFPIERFFYGSAGGVIERAADGREQPMQRYAAVTDGQSGIAFSVLGKYSVSACAEHLAFVAVRACYFADHYGDRDQRMRVQDLGETQFSYTLSPFIGDFSALDQSYELLHAAFPIIPETYHKGTLPQSGSLCAISSPHITLMSVKPAEDGDGLVFRLRETAGKGSNATFTWCGTSFAVSLMPYEIGSYRLCERGFVRSNFLEDLPEPTDDER